MIKQFLSLFKNSAIIASFCSVVLQICCFVYSAIQTPNCNITYYSGQTKSGNFTSPYYPALYPDDRICYYIFRGDSRERVEMIFTHIDLFYTAGDSSSPTS